MYRMCLILCTVGNPGKKFSRLSAGPHEITVRFIVATTFAEITQSPIKFMIDQTGS